MSSKGTRKRRANKVQSQKKEKNNKDQRGKKYETKNDIKHQ